MIQATIFYPVLAMISLTALVWIYMFVVRIRYFASNKKANPQKMPTRSKMSAGLPDEINQASDNFSNLFEMPILFYVLCFIGFAFRLVDSSIYYVAWAFVILRIIHSLIQCTYNNVNHRFIVYILSSAMVWFILVKLLIRIY